MKTLTEDDVRQRLDPNRVIAAIESAFGERYARVVMPPRTQVNLADGVFLTMPCYDPLGNVLGMKLVAVRKTPAQAQDRVQATYWLLDPATAAPRLVFPANYFTDLRTAATSALATRLLSGDDVRTLGIFGTGRQARAHARVLPLVRDFDQILVAGQTPGQTSEFIQEIAAEVKLPVQAVGPDDCAARSDVICTCTTSTLPLFDGNLLRSGTHLNLVGAFQPHSREVDTATVKRSRVIVDTYDGALAEAGDLLIPMEEGAIHRKHIAADLHEVVSGKRPGRIASSDITIFKSVGCALEDLVTAELLA